MHQAIGLGDMKQAVDDVLEHRAVLVTTAAEVGELGGIGFEARDVLARQIVEARNVASLFFGKIKDLSERVHFLFGHHAVCLRHLGGECNDGDRERHLAPRLGITFEKCPDCFDHAPERTSGRIADCTEEPIPKGGNLEAGKIEEHTTNDQITGSGARLSGTLKRLNYVHLSRTVRLNSPVSATSLSCMVSNFRSAEGLRVQCGTLAFPDIPAFRTCTTVFIHSRISRRPG
ncbi:protein of unknown function [Pseudorhizobium banfieldiae]|uniref:Uncharacterized protein n=1 Tax=Pseudorhizobium banfieldiae TaxID=1125847 RepID=L0NHW0_9HYPH|nr:protein of unknown function [Pseudorhizobium banfieldiae]